MQRHFIAAFVAFTLVGCADPQGTGPGSQTETVSRETAPANSSDLRRSGNPSPIGREGSIESRRADFLNRIRAADPQFHTIQRALLNEQNELGVILQRDVDMNDIPRLMRSLLTEMAKEFPRQDLTIVAYTPTEPPRKIGTGRLNAATRDMTYTPAR